MENYIRYLLLDLRQASTNATKTTVTADGELYVPEMDLVTSLANYSNIDKNAFPPIQFLAPKHLESVLDGVKQLLNSIGIEPVFPAQLPLARQYELIVDHWDKTMVLKMSESQSLDFCSLDMKQCPYGEQHCYCRNFQTDWEDM